MCTRMCCVSASRCHRRVYKKICINAVNNGQICTYLCVYMCKDYTAPHSKHTASVSVYVYICIYMHVLNQNLHCRAIWLLFHFIIIDMSGWVYINNLFNPLWRKVSVIKIDILALDIHSECIVIEWWICRGNYKTTETLCLDINNFEWIIILRCFLLRVALYLSANHIHNVYIGHLMNSEILVWWRWLCYSVVDALATI